MLHRYVPPPEAIRVAAEPEQMTPLVADAAGRGLTVTVPLAVALQCPALVAVTVYVVVTTGLTVMNVPVWAVLQT